jgi:hypothetical protein
LDNGNGSGETEARVGKRKREFVRMGGWVSVKRKQAASVGVG